MKKIILTAAAVFAFSFANAQDTKFGIKAGVIFAHADRNLFPRHRSILFQMSGIFPGSLDPAGSRTVAWV